MDFIKCPKYQSLKNCCGDEPSMNNENPSYELHNKYYTFPERRDKIHSTNTFMNEDPLHFAKNGHRENLSRELLSQHRNFSNSMHRSLEFFNGTKHWLNNDNLQEESFPSLEVQENNDVQCPRCGKRMREPRLLPCLHPICSLCVSELMSTSNRPKNESLETGDDNYYEMCPLCDFQLPNSDSETPPPHYPLQHRIVMSAIRSKFANKILCDLCTSEIVAVVQCCACLHNFCLDCGMKHQQRVTLELKPIKHSLRPLWEATKVRRTALCQHHPTLSLRFYCIACQEVTCKECMWSNQHRGHATENAANAGKRISLHLTKMLKRAKALLNVLLTEYDRNAFSNATFDDFYCSFSKHHWYVKYPTFL